MYLIIGASSFIGRHLYKYCAKNGISVIGTYYEHAYHKDWIRFDLNESSLIEICAEKLNGKKPDAVIVCSANTSIDDCKRNTEASNRLNIEGTKKVLFQAKGMGIKSVFLSSEAVFDGRKGLYSEEDIPNPVTVYGSQKLEIEQYICNTLDEYLILRISRAVGSCFGEEDIFNEFYHKIVAKNEIVCLRDQSFCLTEVNDIVKCIVKALEQNISGLYHAASDNYISRYELARLYAMKVFGGYEHIVEKKYDDISFADNRHIYGGLKGDRLTKLLGIRYMSVSEILDKYMSTFQRRENEQDIKFA